MLSPIRKENPLYINSTGSIYMELRLDRIAPWIFLHWRAASIGYIQHARRGEAGRRERRGEGRGKARRGGAKRAGEAERGEARRGEKRNEAR